MDDGRTDLEKATAQVAGLERYLRTRLLNTLTRLFIATVLIGGLISAASSHFLETISICLAVAAVFATWLVVHYFRLVRGLRSDPVRTVSRLHQKRTIKNAGFVDGVRSSDVSPLTRQRPAPDVSETDRYGPLRDVDVLGQKSDDGVNRTDDPSRGPIE
jgi:hypothetical protein